ncbi:MAG: hypothetical protein NC098_06910 [Lachnoclostridium sp.]|nr:hypothetical protein [Lachnoclostridium sp.]
MSLYNLTYGWSKLPYHKDLRMQFAPMPWKKRQEKITYSDDDMRKYWRRLIHVTKSLGYKAECRVAIDRLSALLDLNDEKSLTEVIVMLTDIGEVSTAKDMLENHQFVDPNLRVKATMAVVKALFNQMDIEACMQLLESIDETADEIDPHSDAYIDYQLFNREVELVQIYAERDIEEIRRQLKESEYLKRLDVYLKLLHPRGWSDPLLFRLVRLIGYANMLEGHYEFAIRNWLESCISFAQNITKSRDSLEFRRSMLDYGLAFLPINQIKLANDHIRYSKIFNEPVENLLNPWIANSIELVTLNPNVAPELRQKAACKLKEINDYFENNGL